MWFMYTFFDETIFFVFVYVLLDVQIFFIKVILVTTITAKKKITLHFFNLLSFVVIHWLFLFQFFLLNRPKLILFFATFLMLFFFLAYSYCLCPTICQVFVLLFFFLFLSQIFVQESKKKKKKVKKKSSVYQKFPEQLLKEQIFLLTAVLFFIHFTAAFCCIVYALNISRIRRRSGEKKNQKLNINNDILCNVLNSKAVGNFEWVNSSVSETRHSEPDLFGIPLINGIVRWSCKSSSSSLTPTAIKLPLNWSSLIEISREKSQFTPNVDKLTLRHLRTKQWYFRISDVLLFFFFCLPSLGPTLCSKQQQYSKSKLYFYFK